MGDLVDLKSRQRLSLRPRPRLGGCGEVVLFLGVRVEHWGDDAPPSVEADRGPVRRSRRLRTGGGSDLPPVPGAPTPRRPRRGAAPA